MKIFTAVYKYNCKNAKSRIYEYSCFLVCLRNTQFFSRFFSITLLLSLPHLCSIGALVGKFQVLHDDCSRPLGEYFLNFPSFLSFFLKINFFYFYAFGCADAHFTRTYSIFWSIRREYEKIPKKLRERKIIINMVERVFAKTYHRQIIIFFCNLIKLIEENQVENLIKSFDKVLLILSYRMEWI